MRRGRGGTRGDTKGTAYIPKPPRAKEVPGSARFSKRITPEISLKKYITQIPQRSFTEAFLALYSAYARELWNALPARYRNREFLDKLVGIHRRRMGILEQLHKRWDREPVSAGLIRKNLDTLLATNRLMQEEAGEAGDQQRLRILKLLEQDIREGMHEYFAHEKGALVRLDNAILQMTNEELLAYSRGMLGEMAEPYFGELYNFSLLALRRLNRMFPL